MAEATKTAPTGVVCWNEVLSSDAESAVKFYTGLLGWTTEEMDMGPAGTYTVFKQGDTQVAGCMTKPPDADQSQWLSYIAVNDVDAMTSKATSLGAKVCVGPQDIPGIGRFSVITDPAGAAIGLFQKG